MLDAIGFLFSTFLVDPLTNLFVLLSHATGSAGIGVILLTIIIRIITLPPTLRQMHTTRMMAALQPRMQDIQKRYKDPRRRSQEQMKLYKDAGINPLGCFSGMLIQFPILIALYRTFSLAVGEAPESLISLHARIYPWDFLRGGLPLQSDFLWLHLGRPDAIVLPVMVAATTYVLQKVTMLPAADEKARAQASMMNMMMPLLFGWITISLPSGLGLYYVLSNVIGVVLQYAYVGGGPINWRGLVGLSQDAVLPKALDVRLAHMERVKSMSSGDDDDEDDDEPSNGGKPAKATPPAGGSRQPVVGGIRVESVEAEGRTVNEATENALQQLGLRRDQVDVEVLSEGRPRLLGFRGEPARVRVSELPPPPAPAARPTRPTAAELDDDDEYEDVPEGEESDDDELYDDEEEEDENEGEEEGDEDEDDDEEYEDDDDVEEEREVIPAAPRRAPTPAPKPVPVDAADVAIAVGVLENLLSLMGVEAGVSSREPETAGDGIGLTEAVLDVEGEDLGLLIGRRGQTLASLQYLVNLIVSKQINRRVAFSVDVDGYRRRREEALVGLAKRTASRVRTTGRSVTLEPMPPNERRIVHLALQDDPAVITVSIGEGEARKVAITPSR